MPPQRKKELDDSFEDVVNARFKGERVACRHCRHEMARHPTNQKNHLLACTPFRTLHSVRYERFRQEVSRAGDGGGGDAESAVQLKAMPSDTKLELDILGATQVYVDARPFTSLSSEHMVLHPSVLAKGGGCTYVNLANTPVKGSIPTAIGFAWRISVYTSTAGGIAYHAARTGVRSGEA
jgi:hypothetical protein